MRDLSWEPSVWLTKNSWDQVQKKERPDGLPGVGLPPLDMTSSIEPLGVHREAPSSFSPSSVVADTEFLKLSF